MDRIGTLARRRGLDVLIVGAALGSALELLLRDDTGNAPDASRWFTVPAALLMILPLLGRRRWSFGAPIAVWLMAAAFSFIDGQLVQFSAGVTVAGLIAGYLLGHAADVVQGRIGLAVVVVGAEIIVYNQPDHSPGDFAVTPALFIIAWLAGFAVRERATQVRVAEERAAQAEREREAAARVAVAEERARIARELHDIVAHAVSVIVLQVGAVRHNLPEAMAPEREVLRGVEQTGRTALTDMRRLLGTMRDEGQVELAPQPGLGGLDALVEEFRRAGLPVDLRVEGEPVALPSALDLSAYRIVQEGLTNTLRHAGASHADVLVRFGSDDLEIDVHDDGRGGSPGGGLGHGLVGVRERVRIYGGEMSAGDAAEGGFRLHARVPLEAR